MSLLTDAKRKEQAFLLYSKYRKLQPVADEIGVDKATISRWRKEENWDGQLLEIGQRLGSQIAVTEQAKKDLIFANMKSELSVLEMMEAFIGEAITIKGLRPQKWSDVIATMRFVSERKDNIFGKAQALQKEMEKDDNTKQADEQELSEEEKIKIEAYKALINKATPVVDLQATEYSYTVGEPEKGEEMPSEE